MKAALFFLAVLGYAVMALADPRMWDPAGMPVRQGSHVTWEQNVAQDAAGNMLIVWADMRNGSFDVFAQLVNTQGVPQWTDSGITVVESAGAQLYPVGCATDGGWIVAWMHFHGDNFCGEDIVCGDIFAQKLDYTGNRLWPDNDYTGIQLNDEPAEAWEQVPGLVTDGGGGGIVSWIAVTVSAEVIRAQRITSAGQIAWPTPLFVQTATGYFNGMSSCTDGNGNMLLAWSHQYMGEPNIYGAKVTPAGELPWGADGVPICIATEWQFTPQICPDSSGGCYAVWLDNRAGNMDIYAQRLDLHGQRQWDTLGVSVCTVTNSQNNLKICYSRNGSSSDGFIVVWQDTRPTFFTVCAQKISPSGTAVWQTNGIDLYANPPNDLYLQRPRIASDGSGGAIALWCDCTTGTYSAPGAQRVSAAGALLWGDSGVQALLDGHHSDLMAFVQAGSGGFVFYQEQNSVYGFRFQELSLDDGSRMLEPLGVLIAPNLDGYTSEPQAVALGNGRTGLVWSDGRLGTEGIALYYQIMDSLSHPLLDVNGVMLAPDNEGYPNHSQEYARLCPDGAGGFFAAFVDQRTGLNRIRLSHVTANGEIAGSSAGTLVWDDAFLNDQMYAEITADGAGGCYVVWMQYTQDWTLDLCVMRMEGDGNRAWTTPIWLTNTFDDEQLTGLIATADGCCIPVWYGGSYGNHDVWSARICPDATVDWIVAVCDEQNEQMYGVAVSDGGGGAYYAWSDLRRPADGREIYAQHIDGLGVPLWEPNGILVISDTLDQNRPQITRAADGSIYVAWEDFRNGHELNIYGQRLSPSGTLLWPESGLPICLAQYDQSHIVLQPDGSDGLFACWGDYRDPHSQIYGMRLNADGSPADDPYWVPESGGMISDSATGYALSYVRPALVPDGLGGFVVAWESMRGYGGFYYSEVYAQRIEGGGLSVGDHPQAAAPTKFALEQNYPNPFNPTTRISFELPQAARVSLKVYNLAGQTVATLTDGRLAAGRHEFVFDAGSLASGVYFYRLEAANFVQARKMVLLK